MKYSSELSKLVIHNMKVIETAPQVVDEIEGTIFREINKICEDFSTETMKWKGQFDFDVVTGEGDIKFYPNNWINPDAANPYASYGLSCEEGNDGRHWLSLLLGLYPGEFVFFMFRIDHTFLKVTKKIFKSMLSSSFSSKPQLSKLGFKINDDNIVLPFYLDEALLSEEYPSDLDTVFIPVKNALESVRKAHVDLDNIYKEILKESGLK